MHSTLKWTTLIVLLSSLTGCKLSTGSQETAARIPVHSQESLVELRQSARMILGERNVIIAANAFSKSHRLIIQRKPIRSPDGRLIDTRVDEKPFILELYIKGNACFLRNTGTGQEVRLIRADCVAR